MNAPRSRIREEALKAYQTHRESIEKNTKLLDAIAETFRKTLSFIPDSITVTKDGVIKLTVSDCEFSASINENRVTFYYKGMYPVGNLAELGKYISEEDLDEIEAPNN